MDDVLAAKDYWRDWVELAQPGPAPFPIALSPHRPGLMPFFCLIHWVASEGGLIAADLSGMSFLSGARDLVLPRVAAGEVRVVGVRFFDRDEANHGLAEDVPSSHFAGLDVIFPYDDVHAFKAAFSEEPFLDLAFFDDEEDWRKGNGDSIKNRGGVIWGRLQVDRADVARIWPFLEFRSPDKADELSKLKALLQQNINKRGGVLTQNDAFQIARNSGVMVPRIKIIDLLKTLQGPQKSGPKGPRSNHAVKRRDLA